MTAPDTQTRTGPATVTYAPPRTGVVRFLAGFGTEVRKNLRAFVADWRAIAVQMLIFSTFMLLFALFLGRGQLRNELLILAVIGFVPYVFAHEQVNRLFWTYLGDIQSGVLEQTYLTPLPSWALILGRQVVAVIAGLPLAAAVYLAGVISLAIQGGHMPFDPQILLPLAAIAAGGAGYALAISGLTLVFKSVEILPLAAIYLWLFTSGAFAPLHTMPDWAALTSRLLNPFTPGVEAIHEILLQGHSLTMLQSGWGLGWLLTQPIVLLVLGGLLFKYLERLALRRGTLSRY